MAQDQEYAYLLDVIPCGVYVLDHQWRFALINARAGQFFEQVSQKAREQLIGKTLWEECPEAADSVAAHEFHRAVGEQRAVEFDAFYPALGRWFAFHACPRQDCLCVSFHDVSQRKRFESELGQRTEALADAERGHHEFLAELAHELRNDLVPVRNALHLMGQLEGGEHLEPARELAERQVRHATRLLDDLLKIAEMASGKIQPRKESLDLRMVVAAASASALAAISSRGGGLTVDLPVTRLGVEADPNLLQEAMVRLLDDVVSHTVPGSHMRLEAETEGGDVVLRVRDVGAGIDQGLWPRPLDLFLRPGQSSGQPQAGLRTELALVRGLVELQGGSVEAHSDGPGRGSQLVIRLPATSAGRGESDAEAKSGGGALRVLVVDDNVETAQSLVLLLKRWGYDVRVTYDGKSALDEARHQPPEVMLLDIGMPGMDGYQVASRLRGQEGGRSPILIALTGYGEEEDRQRAREAGFEYHMVKPVSPDDLRELLILAESLVRQAARHEG